MSEFLALPGPLAISMTVGDEFGMFVDLDIDTTNFAWTGIVYEVTTTVSFSSPSGVSSQGATAATFTVTSVSAANGQINLSLTEAQTSLLDPTKKYRWYLRGVSPSLVTRTYLSGTFTAYAP
jgi:hypothetical protein